VIVRSPPEQGAPFFIVMSLFMKKGGKMRKSGLPVSMGIGILYITLKPEV